MNMIQNLKPHRHTIWRMQKVIPDVMLRMQKVLPDVMLRMQKVLPDMMLRMRRKSIQGQPSETMQV